MSKECIDLHWFRLEPAGANDGADASLLGKEERAELDELENQQAAMSFVTRRAFRRRVLGDRLATAPQDLRFATNAAGKPALGPPHHGLHFNASHGRLGGVVAISDVSDIGVDIEFIRPVDERAFAAKIMSPQEKLSHQALDEAARLDSLFAVWTAKEALIKAMGIGLNLNLLPQMSIEQQADATGWTAAKLAEPLRDQGRWQIWTKRFDDMFAEPAIVSIAAQSACNVAVHKAD